MIASIYLVGTKELYAPTQQKNPFFHQKKIILWHSKLSLYHLELVVKSGNLELVVKSAQLSEDVGVRLLQRDRLVKVPKPAQIIFSPCYFLL